MWCGWSGWLQKTNIDLAADAHVWRSYCLFDIAKGIGILNSSANKNVKRLQNMMAAILYCLHKTYTHTLVVHIDGIWIIYEFLENSYKILVPVKHHKQIYEQQKQRAFVTKCLPDKLMTAITYCCYWHCWHSIATYDVRSLTLDVVVVVVFVGKVTSFPSWFGILASPSSP